MCRVLIFTTLLGVALGMSPGASAAVFPPFRAGENPSIESDFCALEMDYCVYSRHSVAPLYSEYGKNELRRRNRGFSQGAYRLSPEVYGSRW